MGSSEYRIWTITQLQPTHRGHIFYDLWSPLWFMLSDGSFYFFLLYIFKRLFYRLIGLYSTKRKNSTQKQTKNAELKKAIQITQNDVL